jgi:hypothetical protein
MIESLHIWVENLMASLFILDYQFHLDKIVGISEE